MATSESESKSKVPHMLDYEVERRRFHIDVPEHFNFAVDVIGKWAQDPDKLAMLWVGPQGEEKRLTFQYFATRSSQAAQLFTQQGIQKGDRVLVMLPRLPEWWECILGLMKIGAIAIPCTTLLTAGDIQYRAHIAEVQGMITDSEGMVKVDQVRAACPTLKHLVLVNDQNKTVSNAEWVDYRSALTNTSPDYVAAEINRDDPCLIYFTSGTVGYPKMVLHTHTSYPLDTITGKYWLDLYEDDLHWNVSELGWANYR
ncbi:AMP-binding protein [Dictyobacter formicarum]|uniref:AMP-dependent synthetase/ligase domain-containing protein n=1 Tax=Dictyobacter formicarum TaxID=2778368 RepID=A0ABQ3VCU2_9CHLR|nr:AMP-binding protein [Dictyobacter formicarum]GHO83975.1 hypothetical protein KSZ_19810 [Dictyobacter formicarum]